MHLFCSEKSTLEQFSNDNAQLHTHAHTVFVEPFPELLQLTPVSKSKLLGAVMSRHGSAFYPSVKAPMLKNTTTEYYMNQTHAPCKDFLGTLQNPKNGC